MKKIAMAAVIASACAYGTVSMAANGEISKAAATQSGVYATVGLGYGETDFSKSDNSDIFSSANQKLENKAMTWKVGAGYKINDNAALEVVYAKLPTVKNEETASGVVTNYNLIEDAHSIDMTAKGILPVSDVVSVYGKAGVGYTQYHVGKKLHSADSKKAIVIDSKTINADTDVSGFAPIVGAGVDYKITDKISTGVGVDYGFEHNKIPSRYSAGVNLNYAF